MNGLNTVNEGMTLLDHFAGVALGSFAAQIPCGGFDYTNRAEIARSCYAMAKEMLVERQSHFPASPEPLQVNLTPTP